MLRRTIAFVALLLVVGLGPTLAAGQTPETDQRLFSQRAADWIARLDRLTLDISRPGMTAAEAKNYREDLAKLRDAAVAQRQANDAQVQATKALLDALGPAPAADAPAEPPAVAAQRKELAEQLTTYEGRSRQAELAVRRTDNLVAQLSTAERTAFAERLMQVGPIPILPPVLLNASVQLVQAIGEGLDETVTRLRTLGERGYWPRLIVNLVTIAAILGIVGGPVRQWIIRLFGRQPEVVDPSYPRRLAAATAEGVAVGILPALAIMGALWFGITRGLVITGRATEIVTAAAAAAAFSLIAAAIVSAALAPGQPAWRLVNIEDAQARALSRRLKFLVGAFALDIAIDLMISTLGVAEDLGAVYGLISNSTIALLLFAVTQPRLWRRAPAQAAASVEGEPDHDPTEQRSAGALGWLRFRLFASFLMLMVPVFAVLGYGALANYLINALVWSALLLLAYLALRAFAQEVATVALDAGTRPGNWARHALLLDDSQAERLRAWAQILVDTVLTVTGLLILLPIWGVSLDDLFIWLRRIMGGVSFGRYTLSPGDAIAGIAVFLLFWLATRIAQRFLSDRVLPQTRLDSGAQDSIRASVGYLGITVAILVGISAMGIDLSSLALIAGALGVGIGFGLQTIVNNFVSGLIMLAERPVKVGDVIKVADQTGQVRAINVRATEVETAQGATVIVPNSVIVSAPVINLTHKNGTTRVDIPLGVTYEADPKKVMEALLTCARANRLVLTLPQPSAVFVNFGASALEFELRVYVAELAHTIPAGNDLRAAIMAAFRDAGIEFSVNRFGAPPPPRPA